MYKRLNAICGWDYEKQVQRYEQRQFDTVDPPIVSGEESNKCSANSNLNSLT